MTDNIYLPDDPYEDIGFLFWQIMKTWQRSKLKMLDEFGLTGPQLEVLSAVCHLSNPNEEVTQTLISNWTNIDRMTVSTILRNLENKKLIKRTPSKIDTRAMTVEITPEGEKLSAEAIYKVRVSTAKVMKCIDEDILKKELKVLLNVLTETKN